MLIDETILRSNADTAAAPEPDCHGRISADYKKAGTEVDHGN